MSNVMKKVLPVITAVVLASGTAFAAHPLATDDTGTQGKGKFQLEVVGEYTNDSEGSGADKVRENDGSLESVFSAGLIDNADLVLAVPYEWSRTKIGGVVDGDTDGLGDVALELKWRFFRKEGFSLALKPSVTLPSGNVNKGLGSGKVGYGATFIASHEFDPFAVHVNLGYAHSEFDLQEDKEANRRDIWSASVAGTAEVMEGLQLVANVGFETNGDKESDTPPVFFIGGAIYSLTDYLDLDLGFKVGLTKPEADFGALAGVAVRF
ncbi:MAG: transporter [Deltaproteobacteria bacterium]|nr:transporter [Deltaproteobacteria bacterium]